MGTFQSLLSYHIQCIFLKSWCAKINERNLYILFITSSCWGQNWFKASPIPSHFFSRVPVNTHYTHRWLWDHLFGLGHSYCLGRSGGGWGIFSALPRIEENSVHALQINATHYHARMQGAVLMTCQHANDYFVINLVCKNRPSCRCVWPHRSI